MAKKRKRAAPRAAARSSAEPTGMILLRVFDGTRKPVAVNRTYLARLLDGSQRELLARDLSGPNITFEVPFHDNLDDRYTVLVSEGESLDAGFYPVTVTRQAPALVDLMLVPKRPRFDFAEADWDLVQNNWPAAFRALAFGATPAAARTRYDAFLGTPERAAGLWNIVTSMRDVHLPEGTPLDYLREIIWEGELAPREDRFFAFADERLVAQVEIARQQGVFEPEPHPALFHEGATRSFKYAGFGEANLQLTFHEGVTKQVGGETWVRIEPDIDYYKDLGAHFLVEVLPHRLTRSKTSPVVVYMLRWIAGRHAGVPEFNPPFTIVPEG
jgi:hypothetical protein